MGFFSQLEVLLSWVMISKSWLRLQIVGWVQVGSVFFSLSMDQQFSRFISPIRSHRHIGRQAKSLQTHESHTKRGKLLTYHWPRSVTLTRVMLLVCLGCRNKTAQAGWLNDRTLFLHSGGWNSAQGVSRMGFWWDFSSWPADGHLLLCPHMAFPLCAFPASSSSFYKDTSPVD